MESAIRFSQNSLPGHGDQRFLRVDVTGKSIRLYKITKPSRKSAQYEIVYTSTKVPPFRAFDWHPVDESLIAVGQSGGEATLLNIADGQQNSISFSVRSQRLCNAVTLNSQNLIAVGLDRVRTDFCLNLWDFTHQLPASASKPAAKSYPEPLHKLAGGEPITSLKFFTRDPQVLAAGVKGQFIRLYDLREPYSNNGLQFATRCVHNLAVETLDDNYFASCFPTNEPLVCFWDKRMVTRSSSIHNGHSAGQYDKQPESSLDVRNAVDGQATIWSLRFSKSQRGRLGVLSSSGNLRVLTMGKDFVSEDHQISENEHSRSNASNSQPQDVYLDDSQDVEREFLNNADGSRREKQRIVSFDFMTSTTRSLQPRLIVLTGDGSIRTTTLKAPPEAIGFSSTGFVCKGIAIHGPLLGGAMTGNIGKSVDRIRRKAEQHNTLKQAFKQSKHNKSTDHSQQLDLRRMSSFANQSWNSDLGFYEKGVTVEDLLILLSAPRLKCEAGYLLNASTNRALSNESSWIQAFWGWIERAERISKNGNMLQDNVDLSYVGVFGIWMEEIPTGSLSTALASASMSAVVKRLVNRLNLPQRRGCQTDYPWHRKLCLHISGVGWSHEELVDMTQKLVKSNEHTKAAAMAIFADEEKLAHMALRAKPATQSHKMLSMALAGAKSRNRREPKDTNTTNNDSEDDDETEDDWQESIASLSHDLADPYARAILAYVKSGSWEDVANEESLPLKHRIGVALRHLSDSDLTDFIARITREVIANGDIEGVILTGTGTREGLELLLKVTRIFGDMQTAALGLAAGGAGSRSTSANSNAEDRSAGRKLVALREAYRSTIMSWNLKFHRVRFDVAYSRALSANNTGNTNALPRPKEQIRLVCSYCSSSISQFNATVHFGEKSSLARPGGPKIVDTAKNPLTAEKAAVLGTVCPKCGRHLPRCGVCDLWLGMPDETYAKWYAIQKADVAASIRPIAGERSASTSHGAGSGTMDLGASMTGSAITTIGPPTSNATKSSTSNHALDRSRRVSPTTIGEPQTENEAADPEEVRREKERVEADERERKWLEVMHQFTVFCVSCSHGFHAAHARMWFDGGGGRQGHRICPVPGCGCFCNG